MQGVMSRELETQAVAAGAGAWGGAGEQSAHGGSGGVAGAGSGARLEGWRPVATPPAARGATVAKLQVGRARGSGPAAVGCATVSVQLALWRSPSAEQCISLLLVPVRSSGHARPNCDDCFRRPPADLQDALVQLYDDDAGDLYDKVVRCAPASCSGTPHVRSIVRTKSLCLLRVIHMDAQVGISAGG